MKKLAWLAGAGALAAVILSLTCFVVGENRFAVVTQFGKPVRIIDKAGLYFKLPDPVQTVDRYDHRLQLFESKPVEYLTKDKKNIILKCFMCWRVVEPKRYFQSLGAMTLARQRLEDILISKGGAAVGDFEFEDLVTLSGQPKIGQLVEHMKSAIDRQTQRHFGIRILEVGISQLALPQENAKSVYERMKAERKAIANKYRAEGREKAAMIKAQADREHSLILSEAYRQSQVLMGQGEAEAAQVYAKAFGQDPEFYRFWRTLETYRKILDEKTTLVLTDQSPLFEYLKK